MIRLGKIFSITVLLATFVSAFGAPADTNSTPDFKEIYDAVRARLAGADNAELNRAAVNGFLKELGPKASLVTGVPDDPAAKSVVQLVSKSAVFDEELGYLRVARVAEGLPAALRAAYQSLNVSNQLKGVVLDLRYAEGTDYPATLTATELFASKNSATLDWGQGDRETKNTNRAISLPLIVLANGETRGAAEAFAALLRETGAGLMLGSRTAGQALLTHDFPLSNGAVLRVATAAVKLNGAELGAVRPDIEVTVASKDERAFFADAFLTLPKTNLTAATNRLAGTNSSGRRVRLTEAELVRAHKQGLNPSEDEDGFVNALRESKPELPLVSDPVLARALDLLKGLAIVRQTHP